MESCGSYPVASGFWFSGYWRSGIWRFGIRAQARSTQHSHTAWTGNLSMAHGALVLVFLCGRSWPPGRKARWPSQGDHCSSVLSPLCKLVVVCPCWAEGGFILAPRRGRLARRDAASGCQVMAIMAGKPAASHRTTHKFTIITI